MSHSKVTNLYTIQFKNGELLRHQSPLQLAQFRCDARLSKFWVEFQPELTANPTSQE